MKATLEEIRLLRDVVQKVVPMIAGRGVRVTQLGAQAYVRQDPRTHQVVQVNIPHIPDDATLKLVQATQGFIDHECGHVLFTDFKKSDDIKRIAHEIADDQKLDRNQTHKRLHMLDNIVEDPFVERKMRERFPGATWNLDRLFEVFVTRITEPELRKAKTDEDRFGILVVPTIRALAGQKFFQDWMTAGKHWDDPLVKAMIDRMSPAMRKELTASKTSWDNLDVATQLYHILHPAPPIAPPPPPPPASPPAEKPDPKDEKDEGEGKGAGEKGKGSKDDKSPEKPADASKDDEGDEGAPEGEKDDADEAAGEDEAPEETPKDEKTGDGEPKSEPKAEEEDEGDEEGEGASGGDDLPEPAGEDEEGADEAEGTDPAEPDKAGDDAEPAGDEGEEAGEGAGKDSAKGGDGKATDEAKEEGTSKPSEFKEVEGDPSPFGEIDVPDSKDLAEAIADLLTEDATRQTRDADYRVFTRDWDKIEPVDIHKGRDYDPEWLADLDEKTRHMVAPMQKEIERMMAARSRIVKVPGFRSGRLHGGSLHRLRVNDDRVFRRIQENHSKETAVTLLVDNSGSMTHSGKIETATAAAYALAQTLERVGIRHEVLGFTTGEMSRAQAEMVAEEVARSGISYTRAEPLYIPIYKSFDERITSDVRARFGKAYGCATWTRENPDGECVRIAMERLLKQPEQRRVLLVLSDGQPACRTRHYGELHSDLHLVVSQAKKRNVELVGIGINSDAVRSYYPRYMVLNNVADLPQAVMGELKRILLSPDK
jgi:hypothetical protein